MIAIVSIALFMTALDNLVVGVEDRIDELRAALDALEDELRTRTRT